MASVWITDRMNQQIDQWKGQTQLTKEGLVHCVLMLAMADEDLKNQAAALCRYLGDLGQQRLENMGL